ncbi:ribosome biogenesis GTP-binding protein YihA/YsxC [Hydrogenobacter hydrogenophilus]|uniref:Probable GTP-binding protein EngB n=1 Tax=Hydrogenobacter hydrogenophilus TaxID=35835 RepID=A0A285NYT6_9AQUI|nr:ribosome biogenesis GTP-binding protein YihA/YsxC [Hydrogenobacter hydrogenophilus]SNZ14640.1 GTP-binding protein [Hydrogenobacter hydrogenophilus]
MKVEFLGSYVKDLPQDNIKEVVFVGRSNVGKSSLINMLVGKPIAKVGKEPGRTRAINVFLLEDYIKLVDVPGYGFAKVSKEERESWKELMERYFTERKNNIKCVFVLIDSKVGPTELDRLMIEWLRHKGINHLAVLTKSDKADQRELSKSLKELKRIGVQKVIITSAKEGRGKKELLKVIMEAKAELS